MYLDTRSRYSILEYETASYAHKRMALPTKTHLTCSRKCKIPENRIILRNLKSQLEEYQEEMSNMCVVIVDDPEKNLSSEILDSCKKYEKSGIRAVCIESSKRGSNAN